MPHVGGALLAGGALWLGAVARLESGGDVESIVVRTLFLLAGLLIAFDLWRLRSQLPSRLARVGATLTAAAALFTGVGFGIGSFAGFLLAYAGELFVIPLGLALLGLGLWRGGGLPTWAPWIPVMLAVAGVITYGFHALARETWDPPDAMLFVILGAGWMVLGAAAAASTGSRDRRGSSPGRGRDR
ncbi:MAG: hypothetical protein ACR2FE_00115 [Aeromicrobium sp.]